MNTEVMFSSNKTTWETPQEFFEKLNEEFNFDIDVCALPENAKCQNYYTPEIDALKQDWKGVCWMNPPYGRKITGLWIKKAYEESLKGAKVVCLIPSRTDTKYWHNYCMKAAEIRLVKGRIKFVGAKDTAPFPSAVVIFDNSVSQLKVVSY